MKVSEKTAFIQHLIFRILKLSYKMKLKSVRYFESGKSDSDVLGILLLNGAEPHPTHFFVMHRSYHHDLGNPRS